MAGYTINVHVRPETPIAFGPLDPVSHPGTTTITIGDLTIFADKAQLSRLVAAAAAHLTLAA